MTSATRTKGQMIMLNAPPPHPPIMPHSWPYPHIITYLLARSGCWAPFFKRGTPFFPDARRRITALIKILLFDAISHQAGMSNQVPEHGFGSECSILH
jgi:hypothetical protein